MCALCNNNNKTWSFCFVNKTLHLPQKKKNIKHCMPSCSHVRVISNKGVNTVPKAVLVWPALRYILDTDQYRCTVSGLSLLYIYIYVCVCVCMYMYVCVYIIINIKVYHKTFHQFRTNYSWF